MKYIAIGDSISAGFISSSSKDEPGQLVIGSKGRVVEGMSFPAFATWFMEDINPGMVQLFKNFSSTGTRVDHWVDLLKNKPNAENVKLWGETIEQVRKEIIHGLEDANAISITLGANELIKSFFDVTSSYEINNLVNSELKVNKKEYKKYKVEVIDLFKNTYKPLMNELIELIREINPKTNIHFLGYTSPHNHEAINYSSKIEDKLGVENPFSILIQEANAMIGEVCKKAKINYIDVQNHKLWKSNQEYTYSKSDMSHPSLHGYKIMGQIILESLMKDLSKNKNHKDSVKLYKEYKKKSVNYEVLFKTKLEIKYENESIRGDLSSRLANLASTYSDLSIMFLKAFLNIEVVSNLIPEKEMNEFLFADKNKNFLIIFSELLNNGALTRFFSFFKQELEELQKDISETTVISNENQYHLIQTMGNILKLDIFQNKKTKEEIIDLSETTLSNISKPENKKIIIKALKAKVGDNYSIFNALDVENKYSLIKMFVEAPQSKEIFRIVSNELIVNAKKYKKFHKFETLVIWILYNLKENQRFTLQANKLIKYMASNNETTKIFVEELMNYINQNFGIENNNLDKVLKKTFEKMIISGNENFAALELSGVLISQIQRITSKVETVHEAIPLLPEILSLFFYTKSSNSYTLKTSALVSMMNILNDMNNFSIIEHEAIVSLAEKIMHENGESQELVWKIFEELMQVKTDKKIKTEKLKMMFLIPKLKQRFSQQIKNISRVIAKTNGEVGINFLNQQYIIVLAATKIILSKNAISSKADKKNFLLKFFKNTFVKNISKEFNAKEYEKIKPNLLFNDETIEKLIFEKCLSIEELKNNIEELFEYFIKNQK